MISPVALYLTYQHVQTTDQKANQWRFAATSNFSSTMSWQQQQQQQDPGIPVYPSGSFTVEKGGGGEAAQEQAVVHHTDESNNLPQQQQQPQQRPGPLTKAVYWQFTLYLLSFWLTWPIYFLRKIDALEDQFLFLLVVVLIVWLV